MLPMQYIRKKAKGFGRNAQIEGEVVPGARTLLVETSAHTNSLVHGLEQIMKTLSPSRQPVTMVLISERLVLARDPGALAGLAEACAEARVTLHVVQPAPPPVVMTARGFASDTSGDATLNIEGLEQI